MREIHTEIDISAAAEQVWDVLTDFETYTRWNPFIVEASGKAEAGKHLRLRMRPPGGKERSFNPILTKVMENQELRWQGFMYFGGLFDVEHIFTIEEHEPGRVHFVQRELFNGLLVPFFWGSVSESTKAGFEAMNEVLKERVEKAGVVEQDSN